MIAFGDSHSRMFSYFVTDLCTVGGASAYGLANPNSITNARNIFIKFLSKHPTKMVIACLGEVDCNATIWRKDTPIPEYLDLAISRYMNFLSMFPNHFILSSVVPPIVESYQSELYLARKKKPRAHVKAKRELRSTVVNSFNKKLKETALSKGYTFIDITTPTINAKGRVKRYYIRHLNDPHLNKESIKPVIERKLGAG